MRVSRAAWLALAVAGVPLAAQTTFYYNGSGNPTSTSSWGTNTDGSGTNPSNFTTASQTFTVQNGQTASLSSGWTISGSGSKLVVAAGGAFVAGSNNPTLTLDLGSGASYSVTGSYGNITFGTINAGSSFIFGASSGSFRTSGTYGGLTWQSSTATATPGTFTTSGNFTLAANTAQVVTTSATNNTWSIGGNVAINSSTTLALAPSSSSSTGNATLNISGGLSNSGTISKGASSTGTATINFNGTGSSTATWGTHSGVFNVTIASGKTITFADSLATSGGNISVAGTLVTSSGKTVSAGAGTTTVTGTIAGTGTLGGTITIASGGTVSPGSSPGILSVATGATLTFATGSTYTWELASLTTSGAGTSFDQIALLGTATLVTNGVSLVPSFGSNMAPNQGDTFWNSAQSWAVVAGSGSSTITGTFAVNNSSWSSLGAFATSLVDGNLVLGWTPSPTAVPEPSTYAAIAGAFALAAAIGRRRSRSRPGQPHVAAQLGEIHDSAA